VHFNPLNVLIIRALLGAAISKKAQVQIKEIDENIPVGEKHVVTLFSIFHE
jgi:hypothetical protein